MRPSMVFPTCHEHFNAHVSSWACRTEPLSHGGLLSAAWVPSLQSEQAELSQPLTSLLGAGDATNPAGPPLLSGARDSWEPDGCVYSHLGGVEDPPGCSEHRLTSQGSQEGTPLGEGAETILGEGICLPTPTIVSQGQEPACTPPREDHCPKGTVKETEAPLEFQRRGARAWLECSCPV